MAEIKTELKNDYGISEGIISEADLETEIPGSGENETQSSQSSSDAIGKKNEQDTNSLSKEERIKIGGKEYSQEEIETGAAEYFNTDLSKLSDEEKEKYTSAYVNTAHKKAMDKAYTERNQKFAEEKKAKISQLSIKEREIEQQRMEYIQRKEELEEMIGRNTDDIEDDDERINAKVDQNLAQKELDHLNSSQLTSNEQELRSVAKEKLKFHIDDGITRLQSEFPELKTTEDLGTVYEKIRNNAPDVNENDALKVKYIIRLMRKAVNENIDPLEEYEFDRYRFKDVFKTPSAVEKRKTLEDFHELSLDERIKQLKEKQNNSPGYPAGADPARRSLHKDTLDGEDNSKLSLKDLGY